MNQLHGVDRFPLSPMQQGMLVHDLKEPHSGVDIEQLVVHSAEELDFARMQAAWQWLAARHDILRAQFVWEGIPASSQEILRSVVIPVVVEDARNTSEGGRRERLAAFLRADRLRGFDLGRAPLLRITILRWEPASFSLIWTFHHALLDGRTFPLLLREVFEAYETGADADLLARDRPPPYRRYIEWLHDQSFADAEHFWGQRLAGFAAPTPLTVDRRGEERTAPKGSGEVWDGLEAPATGRLKTLAAAQNLTLNALVMGAWAILLHRYSGEEDIVFGATRACRRSSIPLADQTIGLFINTVPVRVRLQGSDTALSIVQAVRQQWLEMRPFEHTPLARLKALSSVPASEPLFETLVVFETSRLDDTMASFGGAWKERRVELHELTNFPVTLAAYGGEELSFKLEFDPRRLDEAAARRMLGHLRRLLEGIGSEPDAAVDDLPLITEAERLELLRGPSAPVAERVRSTDVAGFSPQQKLCPLDAAETLHGRFEREAERRPGAVAVVYDGASLTYSELNARANRLAHALVACGAGPRTLVALCLHPSHELVVALLAILKTGSAYVPIDPSYPPDRLAMMVADAQAPLLLTEASIARGLPSLTATVLSVEELFAGALEPHHGVNLPATVVAEDLAYVIYTSGTTGQPKGSLVTHRNVLRLFDATDQWFAFDERDVWTLFHSCAFDFSVWEMWGALLYGGRLVVVPFLVSRSPDAFHELLVREQVTVLNQTPSAFSQLSEADAAAAPSALALRTIIFGGERLEMESLRGWFERHGDLRPQLVNMYGITETTVHVTYRPLSKADLSLGSVIGVPIPDLEVHVLDGQGQLLPIGVPGEMYVGGGGVARGYLNRPELTAQRFVPDHLSGGSPNRRLYKTGDLARLLPSGELEYLGRIDDQVKIRGFRIELGEIESALREHAAVRDAAVVAREDTPGAKRLVTYLVTSSPAPEITAFRDHLARTLPDYMLPAAYVFLPHLPLTSNGKVDRKALPAPEHHRPELAERYVAPRTAAEETLAAIWSNVLRVERVGVHDNFFALGGDSILSIQVMSLARLAGIRLSPKAFFANRTVAELAAAADLEQLIAHRPDTNTAREVPAGHLPLTPIQHWFFEQRLEDPHHYNQALLLEVAPRLERSSLHRALDEVRRHHDGLRLRFASVGARWQQFYSEAEEAVPLAWVDLAEADDSSQRRELEAVSASVQASLNLESGPLWRAVYFDFGRDRPGRLLLIIHHLAVDGVSWRPLLEDLQTACEHVQAGTGVRLPTKTASFGRWVERLQAYAETAGIRSQLEYWKSVTALDASSVQLTHAPAEAHTEAHATTVKVRLTADETQTLLRDVPAAYGTQINDVLLTALLLAWRRESGSAVLYTNVEGHGREHIADDIDVSRTAGWFTSMFPVRLVLPSSPAADDGSEDLGGALVSVQAQLRDIPQRGVGYGLLRYLAAPDELAGRAEPPIVFNYLGQFDQLLAGASFFRFAHESSGPWHSPRQQRRHPIELNSLVIGGRLELQWTFSPGLVLNIPRLADECLATLRRLIEHCRTRRRGPRAASDFPLARLDQQALDALLARTTDAADIYPLSPIQTLFFSASSASDRPTFDQWHCTLRGTLDLPAFERAWQQTVEQHTVLRSTIHADGLLQPMQIVHGRVTLPWVVEDWRGIARADIAERWRTLLAQDRAHPLRLDDPPAMRFGLARLAEHEWKFVWSVPALLLDGWSWPLVFRDVSRSYQASSRGIALLFEAVRPYREYVEWMLARASSEEALEFWRHMLVGFKEPLPLPADASETPGLNGRYAECSVVISRETTSALQSAARRLELTLNTLVQGAWALLLNQRSGATDVVFGAAFAGRPADLPGAESIVGPFVNNLPVRISVDAGASAGQFLRALHSRLLEIAPYQFTPLLEVRRCSDMPWQHRLFDSLVVFQNYTIDESARRFGSSLAVDDFVGPVHTNYPMTVLVEPGASMRGTLIYDPQRMTRSTAERWANDLSVLLARMPTHVEATVGELQAGLSPAIRTSRSTLPPPSHSARHFVPPQNERERTIASLWGRMLGLEQVGSEDSFFDLGGTSLLLVQMHHQLQQALETDFPIVTLFKHRTVRALARDLGGVDVPHTTGAPQWRQRAARQKQALSEFRTEAKKSRV